MSRAGNLNLLGSVRVVQGAGPTTAFVAGTNNGAFASVLNNASGDATFTLNAENAISAADTIQVTIEGTAGDIANVERLTETTFRVRTVTNANVAADSDYAILIIERFFG